MLLSCEILVVFIIDKCANLLLRLSILPIIQCVEYPSEVIRGPKVLLFMWWYEAKIYRNESKLQRLNQSVWLQPCLISRRQSPSCPSSRLSTQTFVLQPDSLFWIHPHSLPSFVCMPSSHDHMFSASQAGAVLALAAHCTLLSPQQGQWRTGRHWNEPPS